MLKTIRIDLATKRVDTSDFDTSVILGNRGLIAKVLLEEINPTCDPLGSGNKLVFATGIFAGYGFPTGDRLSVGAKSPLTGTIKESNVGGTAGGSLASHGIKMIIVENIPEGDDWFVLRITADGEVLLESADEFAGKGTYETVEILKENFGGKTSSVCTIGTGGERLYRASSIQVTDFTTGHPTRAAGRGGLGAVMGSKHIKAIVIEKAKKKIELPMNDSAKAKSILKELYINSRETSEMLRKAGTVAAFRATVPMNILPVQNFSGRMMTKEEQEKLNLDTYLERMNKYGGKQGVPCQAGCPVQCSNIFNDKNEEMVTSGLEYETIGLAGPNCNIFDWDYLAEFDRVCDDVGVDTIDIADAIAVAMDAGYIPWGDIDKAKGLLNEMVKGTDFGRILGNGTQAVGDYLKHDRIPTVKGQSFPAYDPRGLKGTGVSYATFPQGADHTGGLTLSMQIDHGDPNIQIESSRNIQIALAAIDNIGCLLNGSIILKPENSVKVASLVSAIYGIPFEAKMLMGLGYQTLERELKFNTEAGFTAEDDELPEFIRNEATELANLKFDVDKGDMDKLWHELKAINS